MKFGVEIELGTLSPGAIVRKLNETKFISIVQQNNTKSCNCEYCQHVNHRNDNVYWAKFTIKNYNKPFTIKAEGSVQPGFEINTDIMSSLNELKHLGRILSVIKKHEVNPTQKCGMHIHIGTKFKQRWCSDRGFEIVTAIWNEVSNDLPDEFLPNTRRREYCPRPPVRYQKYSCVNVCTKYETIEYRFFDSKIDIAYVKEAVMWCQNFHKKVNGRLKEAGLIKTKGEKKSKRVKTLMDHLEELSVPGSVPPIYYGDSEDPDDTFG